ncbi:MAG: pilus assembly protein TadG-related protein [Verrucomicrobia bacterium]|nr:pilus assembly protein TadG-related protein [Verrucomicrobiota bacterium]
MKPASLHPTGSHRGQTLIFMMMIMIILTFVAFSVYDTQHVVVQRVRAQNSSDSAALTGARWQVSSLNAIGEINLMKVTTQIVTEGPLPFGNTLSGFNPNQQGYYQPLFSALDKLQAKIALTGPMMGVLYAEQAAKLNGMHAIPAYATIFSDIAQFVQQNAGNPNILNDRWLWWPVFDPNNPTDMQERQELLTDFATLCQEIADQGVAALPNIWGNADNVGNLLDWSQATPYAQQYLANRAFYGAIAGQDWCFLKPLLWIYTDWTFWGPVTLRTDGYGLSPFAFLNLELMPQRDTYMGRLVGSVDTTALGNLTTAIQNQLSNRGLAVNPNWPGGDNWPVYGFHDTNNLPRFDNSTAPAYVPLNWAVYRSGWNAQWDATVMGQLLVGTVKPQFNYSYQNADSVWISQAAASVTMAVPNYGSGNLNWMPNKLPSPNNNTDPRQELQGALGNLWSLRNANTTAGGGIVASAAARSFGSIDDSTPPTQCPVVLPVFTDVRLIPLAVSSGGGSFDPGWIQHVIFHVPTYTQQGLAPLPGGCTFCNELRIWENPAFRQIGQNWWNSQTNSNPCAGHSGGGSGGGPNH